MMGDASKRYPIREGINNFLALSQIPTWQGREHPHGEKW